MEINNFRGELTDISAKNEAPVRTPCAPILALRYDSIPPTWLETPP